MEKNKVGTRTPEAEGVAVLKKVGKEDETMNVTTDWGLKGDEGFHHVEESSKQRGQQVQRP